MAVLAAWVHVPQPYLLFRAFPLTFLRLDVQIVCLACRKAGREWAIVCARAAVNIRGTSSARADVHIRVSAGTSRATTALDVGRAPYVSYGLNT